VWLSRRWSEWRAALVIVKPDTTPADWIARARIRRAQRLLETTEWTVERLAAEAGFRSAAGMREHFGQIVGTTPLAYRRAFYRGKETQSA